MKEEEEDGYNALGLHAQNLLSFSDVFSSYDSLNQFYLQFQETTPLAKWLVSLAKVDKNHNSASSWKSDSYFELTSERHLKERDHCIGSWLEFWQPLLEVGSSYFTTICNCLLWLVCNKWSEALSSLKDWCNGFGDWSSLVQVQIYLKGWWAL